MAQTPFVVSTELTAMALTYRNEAFIADQVSPRLAVGSQSFKYTNFALADGFTIPSTLVGRKGRVNEIDWTATETTVSTLDYGLGDTIPAYDVASADSNRSAAGAKPVDPRARSVMLLSELVALDREKRVADAVVNTTAKYNASNRATLSGTSQWSDFVNSDPLSAILTAMDSMLIRPNYMVLGQSVWTKLRTHPKITAAVYPGGGNATGGGTVASRRAVADLLELQDIYVGSSWYNSAKPGQTPTLVRLWGKHASLFYRPTNLITPDQPMFTFTGEWNTRVASNFDDPTIGLRGGTSIKVGESLVEVYPADTAGYLFTNAVA